MIIYKHSDCLLKDNGFNHPERKERVNSILKSINQIKDFEINLKEAPLADIETIFSTHDNDQVKHLMIISVKDEIYTKRKTDRKMELNNVKRFLLKKLNITRLHRIL